MGGMSARWEQDFDVYVTDMDEAPASFVVDLAAEARAPVDTHPLRLVIAIRMLRPLENGLRSRDELEPLGNLEDQIVARLESAVDAIYAGRVVHAGETVLYLYLPDEFGSKLQDLPSLVGDAGDYRLEWSTQPDPEWECYFQFLCPGPSERQGILNRRLQRIFEEKGDRMDVPREIDHLAFFPSEAQAKAALRELQAVGFRTDPIAPAVEKGDAWALEFHRDDAIAGNGPNAFCAEILDIIEPHEGEYDGWGAPHVIPPSN